MRANSTRLIAVLVGVLSLAACEGDERDERQGDGDRRPGGDVAQLRDSSVIQCGTSGELFDNRGSGTADVSVKVVNGCTWRMDDTLRPPADDAHLKVVDAQQNVVNGLDIVIASQKTWRGKVAVPVGNRLVLECGRRAVYIVTNGCSWVISY